jgi:RNA polymerase sigma factor (sigma-70 family)
MLGYPVGDLSQHVLAHDEHAESACKRLVEANLRLVVTVAERYASAGVHILDLIQKGNDGLLVALKTFEDNANQRFSTWAAACVNDPILKALPTSP